MAEENTPKASRPRLSDIANMLGISQTAVSFAINNKPGISDTTRERVHQAIQELGWTPVYAAQALSASKTMTIGFALTRSQAEYQAEAFTLQFMAGLHRALSSRGYSLLFRPCNTRAEEEEVYRSWANSKRVDGVILTDLYDNDPRPALLDNLRLPGVLAGGPDPKEILPSLSIDDARTMKTVLMHLVARGYKRIAYLAGDSHLDYCQARVDAFTSFALHHPIEKQWVEFTDFHEDRTVQIVQDLWSLPEPPDAFIFETDVLASISVRTLAAQMPAQTFPTSLPGAVSFEDSIICRNSYPSITSVHRDASEYGTHVAKLLLKKLAGYPVTGNRKILTPSLIVRESTHQVMK